MQCPRDEYSFSLWDLSQQKEGQVTLKSAKQEPQQLELKVDHYATRTSGTACSASSLDQVSSVDLLHRGRGGGGR